MKSLLFVFSVLCSGVLGSVVFAENSLQTSENVMEVKKSIIKALLEGEHAYYLEMEKTGHTKWFEGSFYQDVAAFPYLDYIWQESSGYHLNHPFAFDGDKIFEKTGIYIDDIPGKAIVIYDEEKGAVSESGLIKSALDGDSSQFHGTPILPLENSSQNLVVFDCLVPELRNCLPPVLSENLLLRNGESLIHQDLATDFSSKPSQTVAVSPSVKTFENLIFARASTPPDTSVSTDLNWALTPVKEVERFALTRTSSPALLAHYKNRNQYDPSVAYLLNK